VPGKDWAPRLAGAQRSDALVLYCRTQSASAGPDPLLQETLSAPSPSFETETVPPVQVIDASVSPEPQVSVQVLPQASCLTTRRPIDAVAPAAPGGPCGPGGPVSPAFAASQHFVSVMWAFTEPLPE
jgi:hypothetical protein